MGVNFSLKVGVERGFEAMASPTFGIDNFSFLSNSKIGFHTIRFVGEATALFFDSTPTDSFIFREDQQRVGEDNKEAKEATCTMVATYHWFCKPYVSRHQILFSFPTKYFSLLFPALCLPAL